MKRVLFVLQCAYGNTPSRVRRLKDRNTWYAGLWGSHTGRRLFRMIPFGISFEVINGSPLIGNESKAVFPPDYDHVAAEIERFVPDIIVACGKVAQASVKDHDNVLAAPHPAWRCLTNNQIDEIKTEIESRL